MSVTPEMARVARGGAWSVGGTVAVQVLGFATTILSARALAPFAFGVVGMAFVVVAVLGAIRDLGLAPAMASGRITDERTLLTIHWLVCAAAAAEAVVVALAAPAIGGFFGNELVGTVLRVQAPMILLSSAVVVPQALLQRTGRFAALAALALANQSLVTAGVIAAILLDAGIWMLVVPGVVASAVMVPACWGTLRRVPALALDLGRAAAAMREGWRVGASALLGHVTRVADNAIIGRLNGERPLGLYAFSYNFLLLPLGVFSHALAPVLLPAFGRLDRVEVRSDAAVRVVLVLLRVGAPFMIGGALTAGLFVPLFFGPQWADAVPLVRILMVVGAIQIVGPVFGTLVLAVGDAHFVLRWGVWTALVAVLAFVAGATAAGPLGVAVAYLLYTLLLVATMYAVARRRFRLPLEGLLPGIVRLARDVAVMSLAVLGVRALAPGLGAPALLLLEVLAGAVAYVAATRVLAEPEARLILSLLPSRIARAGARALRLDLRAG